MSLQVEKLEHNMAKLTIEVDAEEFKKAANRLGLGSTCGKDVWTRSIL